MARASRASAFFGAGEPAQVGLQEGADEVELELLVEAAGEFGS